uniref:Cytochrome P450 n=1 Tax=Tanacetum cinerariifolium TaxID=118510 RepID=A0A6L2P3T3_TANCI|nr:cytochrome P450 [Tanacetum cinerariifolium]
MTRTPITKKQPLTHNSLNCSSSYANILTDKKPNTACTKTIQISFPPVSNQLSNTPIIAELNFIEGAPNTHNIILDQDFIDFSIKYLGGMHLPIQLQDRNTVENAFSNTTLKAYFRTMKPWSNDIRIRNRVTWILISGFPPQLWLTDSFNAVAEQWGKIIIPEDCSARQFNRSAGKVCILTDHLEFIMATMQIPIENEIITVRVLEVECEIDTLFNGYVLDSSSDDDGYSSANKNNEDDGGEDFKDGVKVFVKESEGDENNSNEMPNLENLETNFPTAKFGVMEVKRLLARMDSNLNSISHNGTPSLQTSLLISENLDDFFLTKSLAMIIPSVVSEAQTTFIKGRQIIDGPLMVDEIISWAKVYKKKLFMLKVDFEKGFDTLSWSFLDSIMAQMGFTSKGLRQGDPLSPLLFILAIEALNVVIIKAKNRSYEGLRGLGIDSLNSSKVSLLSKWWWRFNNECDSLLGPWYNIAKLRDDLQLRGIDLPSLFKIKIGNGEIAKFWLDKWLGGPSLSETFTRLYRIEVSKDARVVNRPPRFSPFPAIVPTPMIQEPWHTASARLNLFNENSPTHPSPNVIVPSSTYRLYFS